jgi:SAM-dependent methyltransferase
VAQAWAAGIAPEVAFWREILLGGPAVPAEYRAELVQRCSPDFAMAPVVAASIVTAPIAQAVCVDLAAGPVSSLGWHSGGERPRVEAFDALADHYAPLIAEAGLGPPVATRQGEAEDLDRWFAPESVDLVHIRNGLDHCYDPARVIEAAVRVLKPGASLIIIGRLNEAEYNSYDGMHQWNVEFRGDRPVIWRHDTLIDILDRWPNLSASRHGEAWFWLRLQKAG